MKSKTSSYPLSSQVRTFLIFTHYLLLATHLVLIIFHSFKTGLFGLEFWLTLIVNILLLLDLEKISAKLVTRFQGRHPISF